MYEEFETQRYPSGVVLCEQDRLADKVFLALKGTARIFRSHKGEKLEVYLKAPFIVGYTDIFHSKKYIATVVADEDLKIIVLNKADVVRIVNNADPITKVTLDTMGAVIGQLLDMIISPRG